MNFEVKSISKEGAEIKADGNYSGVATSMMTDEDLARATLFFWRALVAHRVMKGQPVVDKELSDVLTNGGKAQVEEAVNGGRNILVSQMEAGQ